MAPKALEDELNIRLVELGVKPSALIDFNNLPVYLRHPSNVVYHQAENGMGLIGCNLANLEELKVAWNSCDHFTIGMALGYPKDAVVAFTRGYQFNYANRVGLGLIKSYLAGHGVPAWIAYISHVPVSLDFINDNVCEESRKLGLQYRQAINDNSPELVPKFDAQAIRNLPRAYQIDSGGEVHYMW